MMPSHGLIRQFGDIFEVEEEWRWNGKHYRRTALDWLRNYDANRALLGPVLQQTYGRKASLWGRRWRIFFLAVAESFGFDGGNVWGISHYRLKPAVKRASA
jgi:cyclopropane-fatty-acyl-phospholipid synthase